MAKIIKNGVEYSSTIGISSNVEDSSVTKAASSYVVNQVNKKTEENASAIADLDSKVTENYATKTEVAEGYVAKEEGKGLSTKDFTEGFAAIVSKLSESEDGNLLYDGKEIKGEDQDLSPYETKEELATTLEEYAKKTELHDHENKAVIDKFTESDEGDLLYNGEKVKADLTDYATTESVNTALDEYTKTEDLHTHENKAVIDLLTASEAGDLLYNGETVSALTKEEADELKQLKTDLGSAEEARVEAETARVDAESARAEAETARVSAEEARVEAETARAEAETKRAEDTSKAIADATEATSKANKAAEDCNTILEGTSLVKSAEKGAANGVATLDEDGFLSASQIPDRTIEIIYGTLVDNTTFNDKDGNKVEPKVNKEYIDTEKHIPYIWSGEEFLATGSDLGLGTTSSTAFPGDKGQVAYEHSQTTGNPHGTTLTDLGIENVENKSSEEIRGELTSDNVSDALGFPPTEVVPITKAAYDALVVAGTVDPDAIYYVEDDDEITTDDGTAVEVSNNIDDDDPTKVASTKITSELNAKIIELQNKVDEISTSGGSGSSSSEDTTDPLTTEEEENILNSIFGA